MPLIIISGKPCTGKTTFATLLVEYLKSRSNNQVNIELINEESLKINKLDGYKSSSDEKNTRGLIKSATNHKLNSECYVIVDSLNYIKGYRYELYCAARTFRTPHCVVQVGCSDNQSDEWNQKRLDSGNDSYHINIIKDLRLRYESPNENNRWDCPLFKVSLSVEATIISKERIATTATATIENQMNNLEISDSPISLDNPLLASKAVEVGFDELVVDTPTVFQSSFKSSWKPKNNSKTTNSIISEHTTVIRINDNKLNCSSSGSKAISFSGTLVTQEDTYKTIEDFLSPDIVLPKIFEYFVGASAPIPNSSTVSLQKAKPDLLYDLDRVSQKVIEALVQQQTEAVEGTPLKFQEYDRAITLNKYSSLAELQRIRRQFVKINGSHPPINSKAIGSAFIDYLSLHI